MNDSTTTTPAPAVEDGPVRFMAFKTNDSGKVDQFICEGAQKQTFDSKLADWCKANPGLKKGDVLIRRVTTEYQPDFQTFAKY